MRRLESDTALGNVCATGRIRNRLVMPTRQHPVLAGLLPTRHAFDGRYSTVGTRLVLHPDRRSSRIGSGRGPRAEASPSAALRTDAIAARKGVLTSVTSSTRRLAFHWWNRYSGSGSELRYLGRPCPRIARWNMQHSATPSTAPPWTPNPIMRRLNWSMTTRTQWVLEMADSHRKLHKRSIMRPRNVSHDGPCPASTILSGQRQLFLPIGDNYELCVAAFLLYTGADRSRG